MGGVMGDVGDGGWGMGDTGAGRRAARARARAPRLQVVLQRKVGVAPLLRLVVEGQKLSAEAAISALAVLRLPAFLI